MPFETEALPTINTYPVNYNPWFYVIGITFALISTFFAGYLPSNKAKKKASQVSGGEKQRVAIARALMNKPLILMGDEPTGNLDSHNSENVFNIFKKLTEEQGLSLLVVTHDNDFAERTDRIIEMEDGKIIS